MKVILILESVNVLKEIANAKMGIKAALTITRNLKGVQEVIEAFEKQRTDLSEQYSNDQEGFNTAIMEVLNTEVTVTFEKVSIDALNNVEITPAQAALLDWMLE